MPEVGSPMTWPVVSRMSRVMSFAPNPRRPTALPPATTREAITMSASRSAIAWTMEGM